MHDGRAEKIRLNGIDAPEKGQPFTNGAKQFVSELAFDREVRVETKGQDRYGRTIGDVFLPDGRNLNQEIVKAGLAWWFRMSGWKSKLKKRSAGCGSILSRSSEGKNPNAFAGMRVSRTGW